MTYNAEVCPHCGHAVATADIKKGNRVFVAIRKGKEPCSVCRTGRNLAD